MRWTVSCLFCLLTSIAYAEILDLNNISNPSAVWIGTDNRVYYSKVWEEPICIVDNASSVSLAIGKNGAPWIVWAAYDGVSSSIFSTHWIGDRWEQVTKVDSIDIYPDTQPYITIDNRNRPWVVWAGSDGRDDDIYVTYWDGKRWADETMINIDDLSPDVCPVINTWDNRLIVVWLGYSGDGYRFYQCLYNGKDWTVEEKLDIYGEFPSIIDDTIYWLLKGQYYKDGKAIELSYPDYFNQVKAISYITVAWGDEDIRNNFRFLPCIQLGERFIRQEKQVVSVSEFFCPSLWAEVEPNKYIAFGDSITQGYGDNGWEGEGYVPRLERRLDRGIGESTVINEGIGGERTFEGLDRINSVLSAHNARFILVMEGTNDVSFGYSVDSIIFNLREIMRRSDDYGTTPILGNLNPRRDSEGHNNHTREVVDPAINNLAIEEGVVLADHYSALSQDVEEYINPEDVHPNGAGYELISSVWYDAINSILNPEDGSDNGGCGGITTLRYKDSGRGINLMAVAFVFIYIYMYRFRLCRRY